MVTVGPLMIYKEQRFNDIRVVGLHAEEAGVVFLPCDVAVFMHDLRGRFETARMCGQSPECGNN
ncbi:hypothetical protein HPP92_006403 [Vanilla planifolia]|uniref:Uncharacterized protein n=1 Tax=Vanilla planifolia TaxID=51239 RepID=A0A835RJU3_VANPL|nr:hypothetical protein HPP92_006403 [Vanilla planifolia]